MSSSQPFNASSPLSQRSNRRRKSRFTFRHLSQLALSSTTCPLRVIAHIDLDAFYAQCEMVRLGVPEDQPLAVQQWQGLIAINYPARKYGLNRHVTITDAQKACPELIMQHVATWREGDEKWAYHEDAFKHIATHKVSLDPYRLESRRILAVIKDVLPPAPVQRVEKASVDEVFLDLSAQVHGLLLERYPELNGPAPYDDPTENLPAPPTTALDWNADALVDLDTDQTEEDDPDWDDIAMLIGSEVVRGVRAAIRERLKYTCSAGLARNKMLAKLGSGHKKPNQQTIVRNRAVQYFLSDMKFTKIRMLGGKLGDEVVSMFNTDTVEKLLEVPIEQLKKLGDETGAWLYQTIRGEDHSEVNPRTQIKSMLSAKSFRPTINTFEQAVKWLRIFVADIFTRLVEEGVTENKRRPKTINLHHRQGQQTRSKQAPIPPGKTIDEPLLFDLAKNLLAQVIVDGRAWPCSNLSLSVGGFEDGITGNKGIDGFLVRGDEAKAMQQHASTASAQHFDSSHQQQHDISSARPEKRRRIEDGKRINQFFSRRGPSDAHADFEDIPSAQKEQPHHTVASDDEDEDGNDPLDVDAAALAGDDSFTMPSSPPPSHPPAPEDDATTLHDNGNGDEGEADAKASDDSTNNAHTPPLETTEPEKMPKKQYQQIIETYLCPRCHKPILVDQQAEHADFHYARDLQDAADRETTLAQRQPQQQNSSSSSAAALKPRSMGRGRGAGRGLNNNSGGKTDGKQKRLAFGSL